MRLEKPAEDDTAIAVGWCNDEKRAWKQCGPEKTKVRGYSSLVYIPLDSNDDDAVHALFATGGPVAVEGMSVAGLRALRLAEKQKGKAIITRYHQASGRRWFATFVKRDDRITVWKESDSAGKKRSKPCW